MSNNIQRADFAKWLFERTLGWIATADVKVGVAMTLDTAMLGGLATAFGTSEPQLRTTWCYLAVFAAVGAIVIAMFCAGMAAIPRMLGPIDSMIFFARIKEKSAADYVDEFIKVSDERLLADLVAQIHRNAEIATEKHWWVRKSLIWSFLGTIPWIVAISLLIKI